MFLSTILQDYRVTLSGNSPFKILNVLALINDFNSKRKLACYCGGAPRRLLNSVDFGGFQRFSTSATRDWNGGIIAGFL